MERRALVLILALVVIQPCFAQIDDVRRIVGEQSAGTEEEEPSEVGDDSVLELEIDEATGIKKDARLDTLEIASLTSESLLESSCLDYCITGVCTWLKCSLFSCDVETSLRVRHRNPDLVVSTYREVGKNPWKEVEDLWDSIQEDAADLNMSAYASSPKSGGGENITTSTKVSGLVYREADAVGNPVKLSWISDEYFRGSQTQPLTPVFFSSFDGIG